MLAACSGTAENEPPPVDVAADDAGSDAQSNEDSGAPSDADTVEDADADSDADTDPDAGTDPDADTDPDAGTDPDSGPVACEPECEAGQRCEDGVCVCDTDSCETDCCTAYEGGSCVAGDVLEACGSGGQLCQACDETTADSCGASGCECNGGPACVTGECMGDRGCVDLQTDPNHCGKVGHDCLGAACIAGECQLATVVISQMENNTPGTNAPVCSDGTEIGATSWWRRFYFEEHAAVGAKARIKNVTIFTGPEQIDDGVPSTINLYTLPHSEAVDTIPLEKLTLIGTADVNVTGVFAAIEVPVTGVVEDTATQDLVVEWHAYDYPNLFFPGGNAAPQTHSAFISASECGLPEPATFDSIGFDDIRMPMTVTLETAAPSP